jgi:flagellar biosynthesis protein FlhG
MIDQANDLRRLVTQSAELPQHAPSRQVTAVLVAGGKGGVGTTTVAVNLAVAASQQGLRTVLVDADPDGPDIQTLCRLRQRYNLSDVLDGRRTLGETLQPGPGGVMILPGAWATADLADASDTSQKSLLDQLAGLGTRADLVVLDGGNGLHAFTRRLWQTSEEVVLVSSTDSNAVLDTYAALKVALVPGQRPRVRLLVNMCDDESDAREVHGRLNRSSQRFLGFDLPICHWLPADANVVASARQGVPFTLSQPDTVATESLLALAHSLGQDATACDSGSSPPRHEQQNTTNQENLPNRLNPDGENVDSEEDRSLFTRC